MTNVEMVKQARAFKALSRPLMAAGGRILRTAEEFAGDVLPAARYPHRIGNMAHRAEQAVQRADAYKGTLGRGGRAALSTGQFVTGAAPLVGVAAMPSYVTPIWSTFQNAGNAMGQAANWGLRPERTRQQVTQGAQDGIINAYDYMQAQPFGQRRQIVDSMRQGAAVSPLQPTGWQDIPRQIGPSGRGDLSGWLTQRALAFRRQQQQQQMPKSARARALWSVARPLMQKWIPRFGKGLAMASPIPLAVGAVGGWTGADAKARQVGSDIALNELQQGVQQQNPLGRFALAADPSLMLNASNRQMPGLFQRYQQTHGQPLQMGMLANLQQGWNNPSWLASDSSGSYSIPNASRPS